MRLTPTLPAVPLCDGGPLFPVICSLEDGSDLWGPKKLGSRTHLPQQKSKADGAVPWDWIVHCLLLVANQKVKGMWAWSGVWQRAPCKALARDAAV